MRKIFLHIISDSKKKQETWSMYCHSIGECARYKALCGAYPQLVSKQNTKVVRENPHLADAYLFE